MTSATLVCLRRARERRAAEEKAREEEARARQEAAAAAERRRAELVGTVRVALVAGRGGYVHLRLGLDGAHPDVSMSREEDFQVPSVPAPEPVRVPSPPRVDDVRDYVSVGSTDTGDLDLVSEGDAEGDGLDTDSGEGWEGVWWTGQSASRLPARMPTLTTARLQYLRCGSPDKCAYRARMDTCV